MLLLARMLAVKVADCPVVRLLVFMRFVGSRRLFYCRRHWECPAFKDLGLLLPSGLISAWMTLWARDEDRTRRRLRLGVDSLLANE